VASKETVVVEQVAVTHQAQAVKQSAWSVWKARLVKLADAQPFTLLWVVVAGGSFLGLKYLAGPHMDLVVMVMGYIGLALAAVALLLVVPSALVLWRLFRKNDHLEHDVLEAQAPVRTGFSVPNFWWLPLLSVDWQWVEPDNVEVLPASRAFRRDEEVRFAERGRIHRIIRRFTVADVLGLCRIRWTHQVNETLTVLPATGELRRMPVIQSFQSGDDIPHPAGRPEGGRYELRRYQHGDSARHIVWKIYGKSRRLMVREPERAISRSSSTAAYLVAAPDDEAAAAAARVAVETGVLGTSWMFGADGTGIATTTRPAAMEAISVSSGYRSVCGAGMASFLDNATKAGFTRCIVFVPWTPGKWIDAVVAEAGRRPGHIEAVVGTDGLVVQKTRTWWQRLLSAGSGEAEDAARVRQLDEVVDALLRAGIRTIVVDRPSGKPIGEATRAALRGGAPTSQELRLSMRTTR